MRRIIVLSLLALTLGGGVALADRDHDRGDHRYGRSGPIVPDGWHERNRGRYERRDHRWYDRGERRYDRRYDRRVSYRRPVYVSDGYYRFDNGVRYRYTRPVIHRRYFDYRVRPQIIAESYQTVPGYVWVSGQWQWNGYEWLWVSGHYAVDTSYGYNGYSASPAPVYSY